MKKLKKIGYPALLILLTGLSLASCSDEWDTHYGLQDTGKIDSNIFDYIASRSDLSIFKGMIEQTGYDSILNQSKAYTVWAPTNASLEGSSFLMDTASWKNIIGNHIASYSHPVSQADSMTITMLNSKRLVFNMHDTSATMDGVPVIEKDKATKNGLVQVMSDDLTYRLNQWENMLQTPGLDSLRNYVLSLNVQTLDREKSFDNQVFVDSIFYTTNRILTSLGSLDQEDSIYTSILPDNAAWIDVYNRISPYFKTKPTDGGIATQYANTLWSIMNNLIFWGRVQLPYAGTHLYTTNRDKLTNVDSLFMDSEKMILSNGYAFKTSKLNYKPNETWCKEIRVEAEYAVNTIRGLKQNYDLSSYSSLGTGFNVSNNSYLFCKANSTSELSALSLTIPIPNTLSTKYNIYVVFLPAYITDTLDKRPYKLEFYMTYNSYIANNAPSPNTVMPTFTAKMPVLSNITDTMNVTKMLIAKDFEFTTTNLSGENGLIRAKTPKDMTSNVTVGLKIRNISKYAERKNFSRDMRIDCIILEPVQ